MSATSPRLAHIRTAQRDGSGGPSQDRILITGSGVVVLDGASHPDAKERDGGWLAEQLGRELVAHLDSDIDLGDVLYRAIEQVASRFGLSPGASPSTTVSMVRWTPMEVAALLLGDSPIIVRTRDGAIHQVRDDRLSLVGRRDLYEAAIAGGGFAAAAPEAWRRLVDEQLAARNRPDGYWIAEAEPEAAYHAEAWRAFRAETDTVLIMTDGVAAGVDIYRAHPDWPAAIDAAANDPQGFVDGVHAIEETDPDGTRWPRSKLHDDKALVVIQFGAG